MPNKIEQEIIKNKKLIRLAIVLSFLSLIFNSILLFIIL